MLFCNSPCSPFCEGLAHSGRSILSLKLRHLPPEALGQVGVLAAGVAPFLNGHGVKELPPQLAVLQLFLLRLGQR